MSQPLRPAPDARVVAWIDAQALETLFLSAITVAEQAARTLTGLGLANPGDTLPTYRYTVTDVPLRFQTIGERFLGRSLGTVERVQW